MIFHDFSSKKIAGRPFKSSSGPEILEILESFDTKCSISALRRSWELILGMIPHNSSSTSGLECARMRLETSGARYGASSYFFPKMKTRGIWPIEILWPFVLWVIETSKQIVGCSLSKNGIYGLKNKRYLQFLWIEISGIWGFRSIKLNGIYCFWSTKISGMVYFCAKYRLKLWNILLGFY